MVVAHIFAQVRVAQRYGQRSRPKGLAWTISAFDSVSHKWPIKGKCSLLQQSHDEETLVLRTSLSHLANADRIDPRLITNKLPTKLGLYSHGSLPGFKNGSRLNSTAEHGYGNSKLTRTLGWRIPRTPSSKSPVVLYVAVE